MAIVDKAKYPGVDESVADAATELVGPLNETTQELSNYLWQLVANNLPRDLTWQFLSVTIVLAICIWLFEKGTKY